MLLICPRLSVRLTAVIVVATLIFFLTQTFDKFTPTLIALTSSLRLRDRARPLPLAPLQTDDLKPLRRLCRHTVFIKQRVYECEPARGGISDIYNMVLGCVRLAIEAGATTLLTPKIARRSVTDLADTLNATEANLRPLSYIFDQEHFVRSLKWACPQITFAESVSTVPWLVNKPDQLRYHFVVGDPATPGPDSLLINADQWRDNLEYKMKDALHRDGRRLSKFDSIYQEVHLHQWPVLHDGPDFASSFQSLLRFSPAISTLSAHTLKTLRQRYAGFTGSRKDPKSSKSSMRRPADSLARLHYLGAHLRTEDDTQKAGWKTSFDEQASFYIAQAVAHNLPLIYVGSGDPGQIAEFKDRAWQDHSVNVTSKVELLASSSPRDLAYLKSLTWDQQAIVDFEVLSRADFFVGIHLSSFSWQIAVRRHARSRSGVNQTVVLRKDDEEVKRRPEIWKDEFSGILRMEPEDVAPFFASGTWP